MMVIIGAIVAMVIACFIAVKYGTREDRAWDAVAVNTRDSAFNLSLVASSVNMSTCRLDNLLSFVRKWQSFFLVPKFFSLCLNPTRFMPNWHRIVRLISSLHNYIDMGFGILLKGRQQRTHIILSADNCSFYGGLEASAWGYGSCGASTGNSGLFWCWCFFYSISKHTFQEG